MINRLMSDRASLHLALMLALTFSTGIIDAVGYLGLDRVFTGNMTGNVVILGMAIAGGGGLHVTGPLIALLSFMTGAGVGGRVLRPVVTGWTKQTSAMFGLVGVIMAGLALFLSIEHGDPAEPVRLVVTALLGAVMGIQAATARHLAVKDVTTVVVTSTITGFAADSRWAAGVGQPWFRRLAAVVLIASGAVVGALLLRVNLAAGIALAALIILSAAIVGHTTARDELHTGSAGDTDTQPDTEISGSR